MSKATEAAADSAVSFEFAIANDAVSTLMPLANLHSLNSPVHVAATKQSAVRFWVPIDVSWWDVPLLN